MDLNIVENKGDYLKIVLGSTMTIQLSPQCLSASRCGLGHHKIINCIKLFCLALGITHHFNV